MFTLIPAFIIYRTSTSKTFRVTSIALLLLVLSFGLNFLIDFVDMISHLYPVVQHILIS